MYIETVPEEAATGETALLYEQERERIGAVTNFVRAFSARPGVYDAETVVGLPTGLDETDTAVMELAAKVARDATTVGPEDVDRLRSLGLGDDEILDVVLAAAVRCFFSKTLDAVGAEPDATFMQLDPLLRESLTVGRPIEA